jgi:hypothetical protein
MARLAKSDHESTKMAVATPATVVMAESGLIHKTSLRRLSGHLETLPDPRQVSNQTYWGAAQFTGEQVRSLLVHAVSEGTHWRDALAALEKAHGRMPTPLTIEEWLDRYPDFKKRMGLAKRLRGQMMAEAALEIALDMTEDSVDVDKARIQHLQWQAGKLDKETYGETKMVDVQHSLKEAPEPDLDARLLDFLRDPEFRKAIQDSQELANELADIEGELLPADPEPGPEPDSKPTA